MNNDISVCPCKYPLVVTDKRDGDSIPYLSFPSEMFEDSGELEVPEIEFVNEEGLDGKIHDYMAVMWKDPENSSTKLYDVNDHIVVAGCDAKVVGGKKLHCKKKELYVVYHPIDEWNKYHNVTIK